MISTVCQYLLAFSSFSWNTTRFLRSLTKFNNMSPRFIQSHKVSQSSTIPTSYCEFYGFPRMLTNDNDISLLFTAPCGDSHPYASIARLGDFHVFSVSHDYYTLLEMAQGYWVWLTAFQPHPPGLHNLHSFCFLYFPTMSQLSETYSPVSPFPWFTTSSSDSREG